MGQRIAALRLVAVLLSGALLFPPLTWARDKEFNLWPLVYCRQSEDGKKSELEFLGPLVTARREGDRREWGVHPLFSVSEEDQGKRDVHVLWPLVRQTSSERESNLRVLPFLFDRRWVTGRGEMNRRFFLFPIIFSGQSPGGGKYGGFFPIVGGGRGMFGQEKIFFVMFPAYAEWKSGEHRGRAVVWPFVGWSSGGNVESFKVLPFFSRHEDTRRRQWVMSICWPLFYMFGSEDGSLKGFLLFPLFGRIVTPRSSAMLVLWPLYQHFRGEGRSEYNVIWPIIKVAKGEDLVHIRVWPLWGLRHSSWRTSYFFAWPIFRRRVEQHPAGERRDLWVLPFVWHRVEESEEGKRSRNVLWPVASWTRWPDGNDLRMLYPMWFADPERGFERNYAHFWNLHRYRREGKVRESRFLGRVITHRRSEEGEEVELIHLFRYERDKGGRSFKLLKGLLGYERDDRGRRLRLLWFLKIPLGGRR